MYKKYRAWVYKIIFWLFSQFAIQVAFCLSGDIFKFWEDGTEFQISLQELNGGETNV